VGSFQRYFKQLPHRFIFLLPDNTSFQSLSFYQTYLKFILNSPTEHFLRLHFNDIKQYYKGHVDFPAVTGRLVTTDQKIKDTKLVLPQYIFQCWERHQRKLRETRLHKHQLKYEYDDY
jgi:Ca2+-binding EF-hand superfamily protein